MERGLMMVLHSVIIGVILYMIMFGLGQRQSVAENNSILIATCVLIYMILFGHELPRLKMFM